MPKVFRKQSLPPRARAAQQLFIVGDLLKKVIKKKYGKYVDVCELGKSEIANATASKEGKGLKPVFVQVLKHFNVDRFYDSDFDYIFIVKDVNKPIITARRLKK